MKNKKLLFSVICLSALMLSACGKGNNNEPPSSNEEPSGEEHTTHTADEYGFCTGCGTYCGETFALEADDNENPTYWQYYLELGDMAAGESYFCRFSGFHNGHSFDVNDWDPWDVDINDMLTTFVIKNNVITPIPFADNNAVDAGDDGYIYVVIHAEETLNDVFVDFMENHFKDETSHCPVDDYYSGFTVHSLSFNVSSNVGWPTKTYKVSTSALINLPHHTVELKTTGLDGADISMYYEDVNHQIHTLEGVTIPDGIQAIYVNVNSVKEGYTSGNVTIAIKDHPDAEHGFCPYCEKLIEEAIALPAGDFSSSVDFVAGETYYFYIETDSLTSFPTGIEIYTSEIDESENPNIFDLSKAYGLYYWDTTLEAGDQFQPLDPDSDKTDDACAVYFAISDASYLGDAGYIFFEFTSAMTYTAKLGLNLYSIA